MDIKANIIGNSDVGEQAEALSDHNGEEELYSIHSSDYESESEGEVVIWPNKSTEFVSDGSTQVNTNKYQKRRTKKYSKYAATIEQKNIDLLSFHMRDVTLTVEEIGKVANQLGYLPYNIIKIGAFDTIDNRPLIALLYPLNAVKVGGRFYESRGLKPFPTVYWMTCPILTAKISDIEKVGWITVFEKRLKENNYSNEFTESMRNAHLLYKDLRWNLLTEEHKEYIERMGWQRAFNTGIAGMRNYRAVKCLHTHYSHFLARPEHRNVIGKWVHEVLEGGLTLPSI